MVITLVPLLRRSQGAARLESMVTIPYRNGKISHYLTVSASMQNSGRHGCVVSALYILLVVDRIVNFFTKSVRLTGIEEIFFVKQRTMEKTGKN